ILARRNIVPSASVRGSYRPQPSGVRQSVRFVPDRLTRRSRNPRAQLTGRNEGLAACLLVQRGVFGEIWLRRRPPEPKQQTTTPSTTNGHSYRGDYSRTK